METDLDDEENGGKKEGCQVDEKLRIATGREEDTVD